MSEKIEYRELYNLNSALLYKDDLFLLEKILVEDPKTDRIHIKISFDSTTVSADSFKELLSNPDLPASTDKLSIDMYRWIGKEDNKYISSGVSLTLYNNYISCQIHSRDQTWFLGKKSQIAKFFQSKTPWYLWLKKISFTFFTIIIVLVYYASTMLCKKQYFHMILPIISSLVLIFVSAYNQKTFPFVRIHLQEKTKIKFGFTEWCALIGALSAFATLVQVLSKLFR